jgi:hypothetical protein
VVRRVLPASNGVEHVGGRVLLEGGLDATAAFGVELGAVFAGGVLPCLEHGGGVVDRSSLLDEGGTS